MKPIPILIALASFAAGAVLALAATDALARAPRAAAPSIYANGVHGFSLMPPAFPKGETGASVQTAWFLAPAHSGFAGNLSVIVQHVKMTLEEFRTLSGKENERLGNKVISETKKTVSGKDAVLREYEGTQQGRELKWIELAVIDLDRVFLLTAMAIKADYASVEKEFKASLDSFKIAE